MVIGNGLIASAFFELFEQDDRFIIFASGISNSSSNDSAEFEREINLLKTIISSNPGKQLVYFSTCSVYDPSLSESAYIRHKLHAEQVIQTSGMVYNIFRVPNLIGHTSNPHTLLNFLFNCVKNQKPFNVWMHSYRYFLDVEDLCQLAVIIVKNPEKQNRLINLAYPVPYTVPEIVNTIEQHLSQPANYTRIEKGSPFLIPLEDQDECAAGFHSFERPDYLLNLLKKYYQAV